MLFFSKTFLPLNSFSTPAPTCSLLSSPTRPPIQLTTSLISNVSLSIVFYPFAWVISKRSFTQSKVIFHLQFPIGPDHGTLPSQPPPALNFFSLITPDKVASLTRSSRKAHSTLDPLPCSSAYFFLIFICSSSFYINKKLALIQMI